MNVSLAHHRPARRGGFTLVELMITVAIIGIMASMMAFAMFSAQETAKVAKTKALIAKLDSIIKNRWDSYRTRRVPINTSAEPYTDSNGNGTWDSGEPYTDVNGNGVWDAGYTPVVAAQMRLNALHDLMRMEMPERWTDLLKTNPMTGKLTTTPAVVIPASGVPSSSVWLGYVRRAAAKTPSFQYQNAECLYMIVMSALAEEGDAREVFRPADAQGKGGDYFDTDNDGFPEFVDAWGQPIMFLRWAPGFQQSELQVLVRCQATPAGSNAVTVSGNGLSSAPGTYLGGAIIGILSGSQSQSFDTTAMATITGYDPTTNTISYLPPTGSTPSFSGNVVITPADPFDVRGVYRLGSTGPFPAGYAPSFATYPLIVSAGPDKAYGIVTEISNPNLNPPRRIGDSSPNINPYVILPNPTPDLIGNAHPDTVEPANAAMDNIHNHLQGLR